ncbi:probable DNA-directed DNA polymerase [Oleispira antarctica RB-8]|uniref:DNA polymerase III subunit delta' n=1 Tax=Oleispira antarctica RB-8 TaxID=698738 RepID=R4YMQ9_OLEAN|nr:probable DNA-directed DNA polymerase [Oleispira antarctica RB-8]
MAVDEAELAQQGRDARQVLLQDIPWNSDLWQGLIDRYHGAGLPHASLLLGNEGTGRRPLAFKLAKFLLCQAPDKKTAKNNNCCDQCHSCKLMDAGSHPDYFICDQEAKGKQIKVDTVRKLNDFLSKTPQISACQVVHVYPLEAMNLNASNALLKTLEEPSGESYLLLMAERLGTVLPTIRSRTQRINLHPPSTEQALAWLSARLTNTPPDDLALALRQCAGGPLKAEQWLREGLLVQDATYTSLMQKWLSGQQQLQDISKALAKYDLVDTINWWTGLSLDIMKLGMGANVTQISHPQQSEWIGQLVATVSKLKLLTLQQKLQEIAGRLAAGQGNYNASLLIESLLLDWQQSFASSSSS